MQQNQQPVPIWDLAPTIFTWEEKIAFLAAEFAKREQVECPVEHGFEPGFYIRTMRIAAGTLFLGRKHNHGHEVNLLEGSLVLITQTCKHPLTAPSRIQSQPGFHAVAYTLTDCVAETRHPNPAESRDTRALEDDIFESGQALIDRGCELQRRLL